MGYLWEYPKIMCPENCRYRDKKAPFCGYCMMKILGRDKEIKNGQNETKDDGQGSRKRV